MKKTKRTGVSKARLRLGFGVRAHPRETWSRGDEHEPVFWLCRETPQVDPKVLAWDCVLRSGQPSRSGSEEVHRRRFTRAAVAVLVESTACAFRNCPDGRVAEIPSEVKNRSTVARSAVAARPGSAKSTREARSTPSLTSSGAYLGIGIISIGGCRCVTV